MIDIRLANKAIAVPLLLIAAGLALTGCVAPPAPFTNQPYATQPYVQSNDTQAYQGQSYPSQPYPSQPYPTQTYQAQPSTYQPGYFASICLAGNYSCPVPANTPPGTTCACPGLGAPSYGQAR